MTKEIKHQICGDGFIQYHPKKEALAQPEQEPVAYCNGMPAYEGPLSKTQRKEPEQEPVARSDAYDMIDRFLQNNMNSDSDYAEYSKALDSIYITSPQRKPLTDEQIADIVIEMNGNEPTALFWRDLAKAIEAAHNIKE